ncbi:PKD domain-containing protein [uncultured Cellulomonas sp.]|uniref:PKD domain-containing protein n=1 Tax=uncultured Cellulomonas sp. TaxID=189682 RepID=UPI0028EEAD34|nr:PKD domain-containing protein [uncultured Cellulomonas sp.]
MPLQPFDLDPVSGLTRPPTWSGPPGPVGPKDLHHVWFPVVRLGDLESAGWAAGPTWAGSPPPPWDSGAGLPPDTLDEGYSAAATGFRVNRVRLYLGVNPGTGFTFTVVAPSGAVLATVPSVLGWTAWVTVPAGIADGRGIWSVLIDRAPAASVSQPALLPPAAGPANAVSESYVSPFGNEYEGILGVEVDGEELTAPVAVVATGSVVIGDCDANGKRPVELVVTFTPPLPSGWGYQLSWNSTQAPPPTTPPATVGPMPLAGLRTTVAYPPGTYLPSVVVILTPPGGGTPTVTTIQLESSPGAGLVVPVCGTPPCPTLTLTASRQNLCVQGGTTGPVTFTATPSQPWTGPYSWNVHDSQMNPVPMPAPTPTGSTLTMSFPAAGQYTVTAAIIRSAPCDPLIVTATRIVPVADCSCPTITGPLNATPVNACTFSFSATVTPGPSGQPVTYAWDFGDGQTSSAPPPVSHTYATGTSGPRTVTLTVSGSDPAACTDVEPVQVTVDCGGGTPPCPSLSGIVATQRPGTTCTFDLSVTVTDGSPGSTVTWSLPGGGTATGPTTSVTLAPGASGTATATVSSPDRPGCPDASTSTTLTCTSPPPPIGCAILLVLALILLLLGGIVTIIGICIAVPWVIVVGAIIAAVGLILFILWALLCAASTPCSLMRTLHCILFWIVAVVVPAVTILMLIFSQLPCAIATAVTGVAWGSIYAWLGFIMRSVRCTPTC